MNREELRALIEAHTAKADQGQAASLDDLYNMLEPLVEDTGLQARYTTAVITHIEEKNKEISSLRTARKIFLIGSAILILTVLAVFYRLLLVPHKEAFAALGDARIAFVSATFVSSFGLLAIILRGIFRASDKEDSGGPLVEGVKTLFEAGKAVIGS